MLLLGFNVKTCYSLHRSVETLHMHAREGKTSCSHTDPSSDFHRLSTPTKYLDAIVHKHRSFLWIPVLARSPLCTRTTTVEHFCNFFFLPISFFFSLYSSFHEHHWSHSVTLRRRTRRRRSGFFFPPTFLQCNVDLCNRPISSFLPPACFSHDVMILWVLVLGTGQLLSRFSLRSTPRILRLPRSFPSRCLSSDLVPLSRRRPPLFALGLRISTIDFPPAEYQRRLASIKSHH